MNESAKQFRKKYETPVPSVKRSDTSKFDPNIAAKEIEAEQLLKFAELVKGTPNEELIAYKDPKVQELVNCIMAAIILENKRINGADYFPIEIYSRYKSDESLANKLKEWSTRPEKQGVEVSDFLGFKIIPEAEHSVFASNGDKKLQKMIEKRERRRSFVVSTYQFLSKNSKMTFETYSQKVIEVLREIYRCFPKESSSRRKFYQNKISEMKKELAQYVATVENSEEEMSLEEIYGITGINLENLIAELRRIYPNEVTLYKLRSDFIKTLENSELLADLGISVTDNPERTKPKSTANGYRSEFVGLNLTIETINGTFIELPIEVQIQTMEQYRDGNVGHAAHIKLPEKNPNNSRKLKPIPGTGENAKYKDLQGKLSAYRNFLSYIMEVSPQCAIARTTGHDFEEERIAITTYDLYEAFRTTARIPFDSVAFRTLDKYLKDLYARREELFPTGESILPEYITYPNIPSVNNGDSYQKFFSELKVSLAQTFQTALESRTSVSPSINENEKEI